MNICVCPKCGKAYEAASEEEANEPLWQNQYARWCGSCFRQEAQDQGLRLGTVKDPGDLP